MAILFQDSFTGADNSSLSSSWVTLEGGFIIKNNEAESNVNVLYNTAAVETGASDNVDVSFVCRSQGNGNWMRVAVRVTDADNYMMAFINNTGSLFFFKKDAGSFTQLATTSLSNFSLTYADGAIFKVTLRGSAIETLYNGTVVMSVTETFNQTATKHGFSIGFMGPHIDDFVAESISTGGTSASITAVVASATNSAVAPTVTAQKQVAITSVVANSNAAALAPTVGSTAFVSAIAANATAAGIVPMVTVIRHIEIIGSIASALAVAGVPRIRNAGWSPIAAPSTTWRESTVTPTIWR